MKNFIKSSSLFILALFLAIGSMAQTQKFTHNGNWGKQGFNLVDSKSSGVEIVYSLKEYSMHEVSQRGETMVNLEIPGNFLPNNAGAPNIPGSGRFIAIPTGANATLEIIEIRTETITNVEVAPAIPIPLVNQPMKKELTKDNGIYGKNALYPADPIKLSTVRQIRGYDVVTLGITPFQYNPITKELVVIKDVRVKISFDGGSSFGTDRLRNETWDKIVSSSVLNKDAVKKFDFATRLNNTKDDGCDYLIVIPNDADFATWADSLKNFRNQQGIHTKVMTTDDLGGNTHEGIESFIDNMYATWDPVPAAVLLMADYGTSGATINSPKLPHPYSPDFISDNQYADVDGDVLPDINFARITARNADELEIIVRKVLDYERTPPTDAGFYNNPITALGWQHERWFQICSEVVYGFWELLGKEPVRINALYEGPTTTWSSATNTSTVVDFFSDLDYIPETSTHLTDFSGSPEDVNNAINAGAFMLQHRDHGLETGWGEPYYRNSNLSGLNNDNLPFIFSINCLTGKFDHSSDCFAEAIHREPKRALGLIAATEVSYSFVNDTYVWGMYDGMWPDFLPEYGDEPTANDFIYPSFASVNGKYFLEQSSWPYNAGNKEITYNLFHHHGDAYLNVYSEIPQALAINVDDAIISGPNQISVTANEGAIVAVTLNNEIVGKTVATGTPQDITLVGEILPGDVLLVVATKQNYFRYEKTVTVIPPSGPYVIIDEHNITGTDNYAVDFDTDNTIDITIKNVGSDAATGITAVISTDDEYITITEDTYTIAEVAAGATNAVTAAFAIQAANNAPDQHTASILVTITDGTSKEVWEDHLSILINAPELEPAFGQVNDASQPFFGSTPEVEVRENDTYTYDIIVSGIDNNDNGMLDPGESVNIEFHVNNVGHATINDAVCTLSTTTPDYVTLNTSTFNLDIINIGNDNVVFYNVTIDETTPVGTPITFIFNASAGEYAIQETEFTFPVGLIIEDFETGDFSKFSWVLSGGADWSVVEEPNSGTFSAKSGAIGNNESSILEITANVLADEPISFFRKVSSEGSYDKLKFYIDGAKKDEWDGDVPWSEVEFPVTTGEHTFKWEYSKDVSQTGGSDCAWIDDITFPSCNIPEVKSRNISITSATDLPTWLTLTDNGDGTGVLTGTPVLEDVANYDITLLASTNSESVEQEFSINVILVTAIDDLQHGEFRMYPNPVNENATIEYTIANKANVSIVVYNVAGKQVSILANQPQDAGSYHANFNASQLKAGIYFCKLTVDGESSIQKFVIK